MKADELTSLMQDNYLGSVETMMLELKEYVRFLVEDCCYKDNPPTDCGGFRCAYLKPFLVNELEFQDQYMIEYFNNLSNSEKCEIQTLMEIEKDNAHVIVEIRFALYYKFLIEKNFSMLCVEVSVEIVIPVKTGI